MTVNSGRLLGISEYHRIDWTAVAGGHSLAVISFLVSCQVIRHLHVISNNLMLQFLEFELKIWRVWYTPIWVLSIICISSRLMVNVGIDCNAGILDTSLWSNQFYECRSFFRNAMSSYLNRLHSYAIWITQSKVSRA